jgi:hypothetical protein
VIDNSSAACDPEAAQTAIPGGPLGSQFFDRYQASVFRLANSPSLTDYRLIKLLV